MNEEIYSDSENDPESSFIEGDSIDDEDDDNSDSD